MATTGKLLRPLTYLMHTLHLISAISVMSLAAFLISKHSTNIDQYNPVRYHVGRFVKYIAGVVCIPIIDLTRTSQANMTTTRPLSAPSSLSLPSFSSSTDATGAT